MRLIFQNQLLLTAAQVRLKNVDRYILFFITLFFIIRVILTQQQQQQQQQQ
jgi:hypothetical protein